jgi:NAD(P) transhydrogenase subunit beta
MIALGYLASTVLFILSLMGLSSTKTSSKGNLFGALGMALAIIATICMSEIINYDFVIAGIAVGGIIGYTIVRKINMTSLPQLVAAFHSLIGLAAVFISLNIFCCSDVFLSQTSEMSTWQAVEMSLGIGIGAITFTGSLVGFGKLQGFIKGKPLKFAGQHKLNLLIGLVISAVVCIFCKTSSVELLIAIATLSATLGVLLILPIGGADMPVVISMLNSYSGWATTGIGLTMQIDMLIITGALVGTSGAFLSYVMCKGMNRSIFSVIFGGIGSDDKQSDLRAEKDKGNVKLCAPEDAAFILKNAGSVIIVPGYGMAVSQSQHAIKELADVLKGDGAIIKFAIHPVAGRMPGHMNVLLAEANIDYEDVLEIDEINHDFVNTDVAIVIGANDITNPSAKNDPASPIYGMPVLDVEKAKIVLFIKRSLGVGYAGIDNAIFYRGNTMMLLGDAKKVVEEILRNIKC